MVLPNYSDREIEYDAEFTNAITIVYGQGCLGAGGANKVDKLLSSIDLNGKRLLDFGCGLGGPAL